MPNSEDYLALDDAKLLRQCDVDTYKSSGPGGQHRNKVSSAVRLRHHPTAIIVHGDQSRSQHENKRLALGRLRMSIACQLRRPLPAPADGPPEYVAECTFTARGGGPGERRLQIGRKDRRFWHIAAYLLDAMEAYEGRLADAAAHLGINTSNLAGVLQSERHLLAAAQTIRKKHGHKPLS